MAKIVKSPLGNISGRIGDLVIRQTVHGAIVCLRPSRRRKPNAREARNRERFLAAIAYAKDIDRDYEKKKAYAAKLPAGASVYKAAVKEFFDKQLYLHEPPYVFEVAKESDLKSIQSVKRKRTVYRSAKTGRFISEKKFKRSDPAKVVRENI